MTFSFLQVQSWKSTATVHENCQMNISILVLGDSRKHPYLYHRWLLGFPKGRGGSRLWNSEGKGGYLRLEIRRHGGISQVEFQE